MGHPPEERRAPWHGVRAKRAKNGAISFDALDQKVAREQSSVSVAALAALAQAQARLVNPEKSLSAIIRTARMGEMQRTFGYAPLERAGDRPQNAERG